jgi:hypothetical protein
MRPPVRCSSMKLTASERNTMTDLQRLVPEGTTHFTIEERQHRGNTVYAVVAIVPNGAAVPLNGYSTRELAESTAAMLSPVGRANPHTPTDEEIMDLRIAYHLNANPTTPPRKRNGCGCYVDDPQCAVNNVEGHCVSWPTEREYTL